uniref:Uncharacterized protein n=1 Tax=Candidozyma auris TaxID=498019 RepID=A0A0L0P879_CANAR
MMKMSRILSTDKEGASFVNTKHGVNKSTFNCESIRWPEVPKRFDLATKNPARHTMTTSSTACKVKKEMPAKDSCWGAIGGTTRRKRPFSNDSSMCWAKWW